MGTDCDADAAANYDYDHCSGEQLNCLKVVHIHRSPRVMNSNEGKC